MKRILTALATISILGITTLAAAAPRHDSYRGSRGYTRTQTVRSYARPSVPVRNTFVRPTYRAPIRPSFRAPIRTFVRTPARAHIRYDWSRARVRAAAFATYTSNMWARARAYRYWNGHQRSVISRLELLNLAAHRFMTFGSYVDFAAKQAELARIEAEFAYLQSQGAFLAPYGSFSRLASAIAEMRATLASYAAANAAYAPPATATVTYTPYASAEPAAPPAYDTDY